MRLPVIGDKPVNSQVQMLLGLAWLRRLRAVCSGASIDNRAASNGAMQIEIVGDTLMHTQRLAKAAPNAVGGNRAAFTELRKAATRLPAISKR